MNKQQQPVGHIGNSRVFKTIDKSYGQIIGTITDHPLGKVYELRVELNEEHKKKLQSLKDKQ